MSFFFGFWDFWWILGPCWGLRVFSDFFQIFWFSHYPMLGNFWTYFGRFWDFFGLLGFLGDLQDFFGDLGILGHFLDFRVASPLFTVYYSVVVNQVSKQYN